MRKRARAKARTPKPNQRKRQRKSGPHQERKSKVVLLPVDPYLIHVYWEIIDEDLEKARGQLGSARAQVKPVLRFYDITYILFDGKNAHNFFDVEVELAARNWYVHLWSPEKSYCADLGLKTPEGRFVALGRSNVTHTPPAWPSIRQAERYMRVSPEPEGSTASSAHLFVPSREEFAVASPRQLGEKPFADQEKRLSTGLGRAKAVTSGEIGRSEGKGAPSKEKGSNPTVRSIDRGMESCDLTRLSEQHFCEGISSWRPRSEEE
jgi:hypothetical protein